MFEWWQHTPNGCSAAWFLFHPSRGMMQASFYLWAILLPK
jgi:hypothetical protein